LLRGKIVGLRAIEEGDLTQLLEWRNQPELRQYFREYRELSMPMQKSWYEDVVTKSPNTKMFSITDLSSGQLLGACGLCYINWVNKSADFSIYIGADDLYIDDKFASDCAKVIVTYGFEELGLHRLWAEIYDFDTLKIKFFEMLGFSLDGRHRQTYWSKGKWHDSLFYGLLSSDARLIS